MSETGSDALRLEGLLDYLRQNRGLDLSGYKLPTLSRRINRRMQQVGIVSFEDYQDYLEVHPDEFNRLFDVVLINVTAFFRDPEAWEALGREIIPAIVSGRRENEPVRVWSAGCASGEEAFTLAMVWAESLGLERFRQQVKIYATDVDENALARARHGAYDAKELEAVPEELRNRYFERSGNRFTFRADVRRAVIFGRHDLLRDAPISRLDLLVCRNTLIYFNAEAQSRILNRFHFALNDKGFLFLGKAELLLTHAGLFRPVDLKHRVFCKAGQADLRDRLLALANGDTVAAGQVARGIRLGEEALTAMPVAQIVLDADAAVVLANLHARAMFGLSSKDIGQSFYDLELSYRPVELRSLIERVRAEGTAAHVANVERALPGGQTQHLDVHVTPLQDPGGAFLGVGIIFEDTTGSHHIQADLQRASHELEAAYEELQSTNEELETTNEELQSTVEELETTNEELQATNEEHETMNEELQSTNEQLRTMNEQIHGRTLQLKQANLLLEAILSSLGSPAIVLDRDLSVLMWNRKTEDLWGLRSNETRGRPLTSLDVGFPVAQLLQPLRECLGGADGARDLTLDCTDGRGRKIRCRAALAPLASGGQIHGVVLRLDEMSES
ncbi:MAG TPA: CheR family methyltransferase [Methylomirabilota bacterium]|nr:CheR family methyltransferase [Methylomirabilota bacterium]